MNKIVTSIQDGIIIDFSNEILTKNFLIIIYNWTKNILERVINLISKTDTSNEYLIVELFWNETVYLSYMRSYKE